MKLVPILVGLLMLCPSLGAAQASLPVEVRLLIEQGRIAVANGQFRDALVRYEQAISLLGEPLEDLALLAADASIKAGDLDKAKYYSGLVINSQDAEFRASNDFQTGIRLAAEVNLAIEQREEERLAAVQAAEQRRQAEERDRLAQERQREAQRQADEAAFQQATAAGTESAYTSYVSSYPQGIHHQEAQRELARLLDVRTRQQQVAVLEGQIASLRQEAGAARGRGATATVISLVWLGGAGALIYADQTSENGLFADLVYAEEDIPVDGVEDYERYFASFVGGLIGIFGLQSAKTAIDHFAEAGRYSGDARELEQRADGLRITFQPALDPFRRNVGMILSLRF